MGLVEVSLTLLIRPLDGVIKQGKTIRAEKRTAVVVAQRVEFLNSTVL